MMEPGPGYSVQLEEQAGVPLAVIRGQAAAGDLSRLVPEWCGRVFKAVRTQQVSAGRHVAIYWDSMIRLEVGVELHGSFVERDDVVCSRTPSGMVASATHLGPYRGLGGAHEAIRAWCRSHHHRLAGPSWEIYGHWQSAWDADPSQIRTDVFYLLEPSRSS